MTGPVRGVEEVLAFLELGDRVGAWISNADHLRRWHNIDVDEAGLRMKGFLLEARGGTDVVPGGQIAHTFDHWLLYHEHGHPVDVALWMSSVLSQMTWREGSMTFESRIEALRHLRGRGTWTPAHSAVFTRTEPRGESLTPS